MCGIVGFVNKENVEQKKQIVEKMMDRIIHRGPDSSGVYTDDQVALGFRRLSIIDLEGGTQPIYNEDDTKMIIFNGEVYNFKTLRDELEQKGHIFKTHADTEVVLHGYEEWGADVCKKLRGMFAFAIWDSEKKELFGARDAFGIKPYYYAEMNGTFMFGSEIKSFLEHPDFHKEVNKEALRPYMTFQYPAINETFFKGVYRIPEGHYYYYRNGELEITKYWDVDFKDEKMTFNEAVDLIEQTVDESVKAHSFADEEVPVGSFLSSGVDSSYVASVLRPDHTFSIGFGDEAAFNEATEAKRLADKLGLSNTSYVVKGDEAFEAFPKIQYYLDEPDSNPSCVPLYFLSKLARKDCKVVLSGEGADELFAGYVDYGFHSKYKVIRVVAEGLKKLPKKARYSIASHIKNKSFHGQLHLYESLAPAEEFFIGQAKVFDEDEANNYLQPAYQQGPSVQDIVQPTYRRIEGKHYTEVQKKQYLDIHQWMPGDILLKADKLSMANSIELRVPLLDLEVMHTAERIPTKYLLNANDTKYAFRKAANRHLPDEWADRPKLGFPVPIKDWLREEKYYKQIRDLFSQPFVTEFFDQEKILQLLDDNYNEKNDERRKIWTIYTFLTWYKVFFVDEVSSAEAA